MSNRIAVKLYLLGTTTRDRLVRAGREQDRDAGFTTVELAILISVLATLAVAVGALIVTYVNNKMKVLG